MGSAAKIAVPAPFFSAVNSALKVIVLLPAECAPDKVGDGPLPDVPFLSPSTISGSPP